jgi:large subunit ribosomal protein L18
MSSMATMRREARLRRQRRVRKKVSGTSERPRLCVNRSLKHVTAQLIDDGQGRCLITVTSLSADVREKLGDDKTKTAVCDAVGQVVAEKAKAMGIESVAFDRGGYIYHGRVKALAEGARKGGLKF